MQQLPTGYFTVNQNILMSYLEELCEIALNAPLISSSEGKINKAAFTSRTNTVAIDNKQHLILTVNCDDSLLEAVFKKNTLKLIEDLTSAISCGITGVFQDEPRFGFPIPAQASIDGVISQGVLKHASGYIHIILKELERRPLSSVTES